MESAKQPDINGQATPSGGTWPRSTFTVGTRAEGRRLKPPPPRLPVQLLSFGALLRPSIFVHKASGTGVSRQGCKFCYTRLDEAESLRRCSCWSVLTPFTMTHWAPSPKHQPRIINPTQVNIETKHIYKKKRRPPPVPSRNQVQRFLVPPPSPLGAAKAPSQADGRPLKEAWGRP